MRNTTIISTFGFVVVAGSLLLSSSTAFAALCWVGNGNGTKTCKESTSAACTESTEARCPIEGETIESRFAPGEPTTPIRPRASEVRDASVNGTNLRGIEKVDIRRGMRQSGEADTATQSVSGAGGGAGKATLTDKRMDGAGDVSAGGQTEAKAAKFKAGKALADTVKRNGSDAKVGDEESGQLNREKYKKLEGDTFPPPPLLPEDDTCVSISDCIP